MDLAIGMSGTSMTAKDVLKALMEESDLARPTQPLGEEKEVAATSSTPQTMSTDDRLTALEQSTATSQVSILDRLTKMEKQMKKQARRSSKGGSAVEAEEKEDRSRCDCPAQKIKMERDAREQRERMEADARDKEEDLVSRAEQRRSFLTLMNGPTDLSPNSNEPTAVQGYAYGQATPSRPQACHRRRERTLPQAGSCTSAGIATGLKSKERGGNPVQRVESIPQLVL